MADNQREMEEQERGMDYSDLELSAVEIHPAKAIAVHPQLEKMKQNFRFFWLGCFLYACFYTFCRYHNAAGITAPFLAAVTLIFCFYCLKQLGVTIKKDGVLYAVLIELLGIHLCTTGDSFLITFDWIGMLLLLVSGMLHQIYEDRGWGPGSYFKAILQTVFGALEYLVSPFSDLKLFYHNKKSSSKRNGTVTYVLIGIGCGLPLVILVLCLLQSADAMFGQMLSSMFTGVEVPEHLIRIIIMSVAVFLVFYGSLCKLCSHTLKVTDSEPKSYHPVIAVTINAMLSVIYLVFCIIQIVYLFIGKGTLPSGYTYASYARQGFFQLLFVCLINMILVLICLYYFRSNSLLKGMLAFITGCTYIMIASSAYRMLLYIEMYQLTYLRVLVLWALAVIFCVMTGIFIYICRAQFPLFRYSMVVVAVLYLSLAYAKPDSMIASYNLSSRFLQKQEAMIDYSYLNRCSSDAAPVIADVMEAPAVREKPSAFDRFWEKMEAEEMTFRTYNFSKAEAKKLAEHRMEENIK